MPESNLLWLSRLQNFVRILALDEQVDYPLIVEEVTQALKECLLVDPGMAFRVEEIVQIIGVHADRSLIPAEQVLELRAAVERLNATIERLGDEGRWPQKLD